MERLPTTSHTTARGAASRLWVPGKVIGRLPATHRPAAKCSFVVPAGAAAWQFEVYSLDPPPEPRQEPTQEPTQQPQPSQQNQRVTLRERQQWIGQWEGFVLVVDEFLRSRIPNLETENRIMGQYEMLLPSTNFLVPGGDLRRAPAEVRLGTRLFRQVERRRNERQHAPQRPGHEAEAEGQRARLRQSDRDQQEGRDAADVGAGDGAGAGGFGTTGTRPDISTRNAARRARVEALLRSIPRSRAEALMASIRSTRFPPHAENEDGSEFTQLQLQVMQGRIQHLRDVVQEMEAYVQRGAVNLQRGNDLILQFNILRGSVRRHHSVALSGSRWAQEIRQLSGRQQQPQRAPSTQQFSALASRSVIAGHSNITHTARNTGAPPPPAPPSVPILHAHDAHSESDRDYFSSVGALDWLFGGGGDAAAEVLATAAAEVLAAEEEDGSMMLGQSSSSHDQSSAGDGDDNGDDRLSKRRRRH
jgi:hypothetical protein